MAPAMVVGVDQSTHGFFVLEWTLNHLFAAPDPLFKLVVVTAKPSASSVISLTERGDADHIPVAELDLKKSALGVIERAKELCHSYSVTDAVFEVQEGDARHVLCEAVEKHHADMLVVGSHGHGAIKRAVLGSVSDYCAHHAHCTVMIVKKPKQHKH